MLYILYASLCVFNTDEWAACWRTHADTEVDISLSGDQETRNKADEGKQREIRKGERGKWESKMESGRRRRGEKRQRESGEPPKWLLNCFKMVISVIRGKSIAEACSIRGHGDSASLSFSPSFCHFLSHHFFSAPSHVLLLRPVHLFSAARVKKKAYTSLLAVNLPASSQPRV